jgi:hypothetical protein
MDAQDRPYQPNSDFSDRSLNNKHHAASESTTVVARTRRGVLKELHHERAAHSRACGHASHVARGPQVRSPHLACSFLKSSSCFRPTQAPSVAAPDLLSIAQVCIDQIGTPSSHLNRPLGLLLAPESGRRNGTLMRGLAVRIPASCPHSMSTKTRGKPRPLPPNAVRNSKRKRGRLPADMALRYSTGQHNLLPILLAVQDCR